MQQGEAGHPADMTQITVTTSQARQGLEVARAREMESRKIGGRLRKLLDHVLSFLPGGDAGWNDGNVFQTRIWSLRFVNPEVEKSFTLGQIDKMYLNISRCALLLVLICALNILQMLMLGEDVLTERERTNMKSMIVLMILSFLSAVLAQLQEVRTFLGFLGAEVYIFLTMCTLLVVIAIVPCMFQADSSSDYNYYRISVTALGLDAVITGTHLATPARWFVMVWADIFFVIGFAYCNATISGEGLFDIYSFAVFCGLVAAACIGLRSQELDERALFATIVDERKLRAQAEFSHEKLKSRGPRAAPIREPGPVHGSSRSDDSVPETTATGGLFAQLHYSAMSKDESEMMGPGLDSQVELKRLVDLGVQEQWLIAPNELEIDDGQVLGTGGQGQIVGATFCCCPVAVKRHRATFGRINPTVFDELRILRHLRHPNIMLFHGANLHMGGSSFSINLVLEKVEGERLDAFLAQLEGSPESHNNIFCRRRPMLGLCQALAYLHTRRPCIVHGDLKPSNVLVEHRQGGPFAKLLDFGLSCQVTHNAVLSGGTPMYMAPEVRQNNGKRPYPSADIFSLGKLLLLVASGRKAMVPPDPGGGDSAGSVEEGEPTGTHVWPPSFELLELWRELIGGCTSKNARKRPTASTVHKHLNGKEKEEETGETRDTACGGGGDYLCEALGANSLSEELDREEFDRNQSSSTRSGESSGGIRFGDVPFFDARPPALAL